MEPFIFHYNRPHHVKCTIAGMFVDDSLQLSISIVSPKDQFIRKVGRLKAVGRLHSTKYNLEVSLYNMKLPSFLGITTEEFNIRFKVTDTNPLGPAGFMEKWFAFDYNYTFIQMCNLILKKYNTSIKLRKLFNY